MTYTMYVNMMWSRDNKTTSLDLHGMCRPNLSYAEA